MNESDTVSQRSQAAWRQVYRLLRQAELMAQATGHSNDALLASMIAGQSLGYGCLPDDLGLGEARYSALLQRHFHQPAALAPQPARDPLPEHPELVALMVRYRAGLDPSEYDMAEIIATACAGADHLWQDLGLANRQELSSLIANNFPRLFARNIGDMKWKKFLYKQLCEEEGIYACRAPSCAECKDQPACFGPE